MWESIVFYGGHIKLNIFWINNINVKYIRTHNNDRQTSEQKRVIIQFQR